MNKVPKGERVALYQGYR